MKSKYVLMGLDDEDNDKLTTLLSNKTAKKIIGYLSEHEEATQSELAKELSLAISTVHYNLEQLLEVGLIDWEHYHYSEKGKEVRHYRLAQQYIIIAPKKKENILETLKDILPAFLVGLLGTAFLFFTHYISVPGTPYYQENQVQRSMVEESADMLAMSAPMQTDVFVVHFYQEPWFWFLVGALTTLLVVIITKYIMKKRGKKQ